MTELAGFTDVHSHHIEGWVDGFPDRQRIDLVSQIDGNLWMGGCLDGAPLPDDFRYVVSLYPAERYELAPGTERTEFPLQDAGAVPPLATLREAARRVQEVSAEGTTLVHCQAGLNRSGLVLGLAMVLDGYEARDAIELMRSRRSPAVLCNGVFEDWLRRFDPTTAGP